MKTRVVILILLFIFAWTFPLTHNVEVKLNITNPKPTAPQTEATWAQKQANKAMAMRYASAGWGWDKTQRRCAYLLFMKESKFDHLAKNQQGSSAFGIGQMLKETSKDPSIQILHAYRYIQHRYGTPCKAWRHHRLGWY